MEYKKEIDLVLRGLFFEDWMDEEDYNELIQTAISIKNYLMILK